MRYLRDFGTCISLAIFAFLMYHVDVYIIIMARPSTPTKDMKELYPGSPTIGTPGHSSSNPVPDDEHVEILGFRQIDMTSAKKLKSKIGVRGRVEKTATLGTIPHAANNKPDGNKIRVSGFDVNSKWYSSFTAGSTVRIEDPLVTILNTKTKLADIIARKIPNEKFVSVSGIAYDISDIVNFDIGSAGHVAAADRELTLKSSSGDHVKLLLHGQSARSVSTAEEGTEMFFGPVKVLLDDLDTTTVYLESIPYETKRCDNLGRQVAAVDPSIINCEVSDPDTPKKHSIDDQINIHKKPATKDELHEETKDITPVEKTVVVKKEQERRNDKKLKTKQ